MKSFFNSGCDQNEFLNWISLDKKGPPKMSKMKESDGEENKKGEK